MIVLLLCYYEIHPATLDRYVRAGQLGSIKFRSLVFLTEKDRAVHPLLSPQTENEAGSGIVHFEL